VILSKSRLSESAFKGGREARELLRERERERGLSGDSQQE
jgi:hypothetical protein